MGVSWLFDKLSRALFKQQQRRELSGSTRCGACEKHILPGTKVGLGKRGQSYPYVHLTSECCDNNDGSFYGVWTEGGIDTSSKLDGPRSHA